LAFFKLLGHLFYIQAAASDIQFLPLKLHISQFQRFQANRETLRVEVKEIIVP
jgi:hypothetical protein